MNLLEGKGRRLASPQHPNDSRLAREANVPQVLLDDQAYRIYRSGVSSDSREGPPGTKTSPHREASQSTQRRKQSLLQFHSTGLSRQIDSLRKESLRTFIAVLPIRIRKQISGFGWRLGCRRKGRLTCHYRLQLTGWTQRTCSGLKLGIGWKGRHRGRSEPHRCADKTLGYTQDMFTSHRAQRQMRGARMWVDAWSRRRAMRDGNSEFLLRSLSEGLRFSSSDFLAPRKSKSLLPHVSSLGRHVSTKRRYVFSDEATRKLNQWWKLPEVVLREFRGCRAV